MTRQALTDLASKFRTTPVLVDKLSPNAVAEVATKRKEISEKFLTGIGVEVGAGNRPFPVPRHAQVFYGDIRDLVALQQYFKNDAVTEGMSIDAQTFAGIKDRSLDFVISAHVIEHLRDPVGSIVNGLRVIRPGGVYVLAVPDMRFTFDRRRPETSVEHLLADYLDGGQGTCRQAYEEHLRFVHPELTGEHYPANEIQSQASENVKRWREFDIHFHAWTRQSFEALLRATADLAPFSIAENAAVGNENIFVLRTRT